MRNHIWTFISCTLTCPYYSSPKTIFASSVSLIILFFYYHPYYDYLGPLTRSDIKQVLVLKNPDDRHAVAFKILTNASSRYSVRPPSGVVEKQSEVHVRGELSNTVYTLYCLLTGGIFDSTSDHASIPSGTRLLRSCFSCAINQDKRGPEGDSF